LSEYAKNHQHGAQRASLLNIFIVSLLLAAIVPTLVVAGTVGISLYRYLQREIRASSQSLNEAVALETKRFLNGAEGHIASYSALLDSDLRIGEAGGLIDVTREAHPEITRVLVLDSDARLLLASPTELNSIGRDFSGLNLTLGDEAEGKVSYSRSYLSPFDGTVTVYLGVRNASKRSILIELNLESLSLFLLPLRISARDRIAIIDRAGRFVAHTSPDYVREQRYETILGPYAAASGARSVELEGTLASVMDIPGTSWRVVYYRDTTEVRGVLSSILGIASFMSLACMLGAVSVGLYMRSSVSRAIRLYTGDVKAVSEGFYDNAISSPFEELMPLSRSIRLMGKAVAEREEQLHSALNEREQLLREIHHRVKNNLQIIISLLNLEVSRLPEGTDTASFSASIDRIYAMGLIHQILYSQDSLDAVDIGDYSARLLSYMGGAYGRPGIRIEQELVLREPLHYVRRHVVRVGAAAEADVEAKFDGQLVADARAAGDADEALAQALGLKELDELRHVVDVRILLGDDLAYQYRVGLHLEREVYELLVRHLGAEVVRFHLRRSVPGRNGG
jgi:hypothetical protein